MINVKLCHRNHKCISSLTYNILKPSDLRLNAVSVDVIGKTCTHFNRKSTSLMKPNIFKNRCKATISASDSSVGIATLFWAFCAS